MKRTTGWIFSYLEADISCKLVIVPVTKPRTPKEMIKRFFHRIQLKRPRPDSQSTTSSMNEGNMSPSVDKQTAPTKEMNGPIFGTAIATATETVKLLLKAYNHDNVT